MLLLACGTLQCEYVFFVSCREDTMLMTIELNDFFTCKKQIVAVLKSSFLGYNKVCLELDPTLYIYQVCSISKVSWVIQIKK